MLSHIGVVTNISDSLAHCKAGKTVFTSLPFYHAYGLVTCVWVNMLNGAHMYVNGNLKMMLRDMRAAQAESLCSVPLIMETIYRRVWEAIEEAGKKEQVEKLIRLNLFLKKFGLSFQTGKLKAAKEKFFGPLHIVSCGGAHISKKYARSWIFLASVSFRDMELQSVLLSFLLTAISPLRWVPLATCSLILT